MSDYVLSGPESYVDYDRPWGFQRQWLVSTDTANILSNFLAVFLTIATTSLFVILKRIIVLNTSIREDRAQLRQTAERSHSAQGTSLRSILSLVSQFRSGYHGGDVAPRRSCLVVWWDILINFRHGMTVSREPALQLLLAVGMATLFFGSIVLGVLSSKVVSDSVAISTHPGCGIFTNLTSGNFGQAQNTLEERYELELESAEYAKRCYNAEDGADGCNFFYKQSIPVFTVDNDTCPFKSDFGDLCLQGPSSAFTLSTGNVSPESIGVNTPYKYTFQRNITCSPLRMDGFTQVFRNEKNEPYVRYFYGHRDGSVSCSPGTKNCTFEVHLVYDEVTPSYRVLLEHTHGTFVDMSTWQPIWYTNLRASEFSIIILVQNIGIIYPGKSEDPIFPAESTHDGQWYYNRKLEGGVLGCIERTTLCAPDGTTCGTMYDFLTNQFHMMDDNMDKFFAFLMIALSLSSSNVGNALALRGSEVLDAKPKLRGSTSLALAQEQWKVEARGLFEASLARIQIAARSLARGNPNRLVPGPTDVMNRRYRGVCNTYKFKSTGWQNVWVSGYLGAIFGGLLIIIIGISKENEELWIEAPYKRVTESRQFQSLLKHCKTVILSPKHVPEGYRFLLNHARMLAKPWFTKFPLLKRMFPVLRGSRPSAVDEVQIDDLPREIMDGEGVSENELHESPDNELP